LPVICSGVNINTGMLNPISDSRHMIRHGVKIIGRIGERYY